MAPNFRHGRGTRVLMNTRDLSVIFNAAEQTRKVEVAKTTTFATSTGGQTKDHTYIPGLRDATLTVEGLADGSTEKVDHIVRDALGASTRQRWTWSPGQAASGGDAYLVDGDATEFAVTATPGDAVAVTATVQASEARSGYWLAMNLATPAASASTGNGSAVVSPDASTAIGGTLFGGVAHCHVVSATTSTGRIKVQHSTDGATWADLLTINFSSGRSITRSTVAGTVKEQLRAQMTQLSPAGVQIALAFARHPYPLPTGTP